VSNGEGWVDISHRLVEHIPRVAMFPSPRYRRFASMPADPMNVTSIEMVTHVGTHVDAPSHFMPSGATIDQLPLDRFVGRGIVCRVAPTEALGLIETDALIDRDRIEAGDIVILDTGWARQFGQAGYHAHPSLSENLARWLVARRVKLVAVDLPTPDLAVQVRPPGFGWPVHHILLGAEVLIAEHVTNLAAVSGQRVEALFAPLCIAGADGAPVRALVRALRR
jgi:arylformamidase